MSAPPAGGAKEVLIDEENCLLFEAGNVKQLVEAIHRLLHDRPLRERISHASQVYGRARV